MVSSLNSLPFYKIKTLNKAWLNNEDCPIARGSKMPRRACTSSISLARLAMPETDDGSS